MYVLLIELWGVSCPEDNWWGVDDKGKCRYTANCKISKRELEGVKKEGMVRVEELRGKGEKGMYEIA